MILFSTEFLIATLLIHAAPGKCECMCRNKVTGRYCGGTTEAGQGCDKDTLYTCHSHTGLPALPAFTYKCPHGQECTGPGGQAYCSVSSAAQNNCFCKNKIEGTYCGGLNTTSEGCAKNTVYTCEVNDGVNSRPPLSTKRCRRGQVCVEAVVGKAECMSTGQRNCKCDNQAAGSYCADSGLKSEKGGCQKEQVYKCPANGGIFPDPKTDITKCPTGQECISTQVGEAYCGVKGQTNCRCNNQGAGTYCGGSEFLKSESDDGCAKDTVYTCPANGVIYPDPDTDITKCPADQLCISNTPGDAKCMKKPVGQTTCKCNNILAGKYCGRTTNLKSQKPGGCIREAVYTCPRLGDTFPDPKTDIKICGAYEECVPGGDENAYCKIKPPGPRDCRCNNRVAGTYCGGERHLVKVEGRGCIRNTVYTCPRNSTDFPRPIKECGAGNECAAGSPGKGFCRKKKS